MKIYTVWLTDLLAHNDDDGFDFKIAVIAKDMMDAVIKADDFLEKLKEKFKIGLDKSGKCAACSNAHEALEVEMIRFYAEVVDGVGVNVGGDQQDEDINKRKPCADDWIESIIQRQSVSHGHE